MISTGLPDNTDICSEARKHADVLRRLLETTEELISAVRAWDSELIDSLTQTRAELCLDLGRTAPPLRPIINDELFMPEEVSYQQLSELRALAAHLRSAEELLRAKQVECEAVLSEEMGRCKSTLLSLNQRNDLRQVYRGTDLDQNARFLDRRF